MANNQQGYKLGLICLLFSTLLSSTFASFPYYGTKIGALKRLHHGVSGDVYAVDSRTIFVKNFNYDGEAPAAYFYVGNTNKPSNDGAARLRDERGSTAALTHRYRNKDITLSLPEGKTLSNIKWFSVWCDEFAVNFGDVSIPSNLDFPRPQKVDSLKGVHGVSSDAIVIVDAQTLLVPNFSYDGEAPDAKFWVGRGQRPTSQGLRIPDENGTEQPLRRYDKKTIVLTLPGDLTIFDIGHFGIWCEAFTVDFGNVRIPEGLNVPPSLKMLGISPQSKLNCEVLYDDLAFEVRWAVAGESIVVQLVAKLAKNEYMSFGISPSNDRTVMIGSDVVVAWVDQTTGKGYAQDYYLDDKSQCSGARGTCPDVNIEENTNSVRLLNAAMVNGYSIVTYQRSLQATDKYDLPIAVNTSQAIVWAIGPLNERKEASFHSHYTKRTHLINFGRQPTWNCPMPEGGKSSNISNDGIEEIEDNSNGYTEANVPAGASRFGEPEAEFYDSNRAQALQRPQNRRPEPTSQRPQQRPVPTPKPANTNGAWDIPAIQCYEPEDGVFYAQMGPTGGKHGYPAITGHVGWGISWYINGLLIPEIHVVRGKTYTFVVEGGNNPDIPAKYHPFYITDDPIGGYEHKRDEEKQSVRIYAGVTRSRTGKVSPNGIGRLCNWTPDIDGPPADDFQSFGAYQRTLTLKCDPGEPGVITWKPDSNTPDTVYYHCFTHRYLGWKIHVHDTCDDVPYAASEKHEVKVPFEEDIAAESSIRHETKVSPNDNFLLKHQTDLIKNHNMNGTPPKLTFEITKSTEITKLISDGIRAAEALEESILRNKPTAYAGSQASQYLPHTPNSQPSLKQQQPSKTSSVAANAIPSQKPYLSTTAPEMLHGETHMLHQNYQSQIHSNTHSLPSHQLLHHHHPHLTNFTNLPAQSQKTIGLSEYLRPPQNAPLFRPVKLPGRRPFPSPAKKAYQTKPVLPQQLHRIHPVLTQQQQQAASIIPQPSVIVNHYRKPLPNILKPFMKEKVYPIQPLAASVLLLGQPTELGNQRKSDGILHAKSKPVIPVPYGDSIPQDSLQHNSFAFNGNNHNKNEKKTMFSNTENHPIIPTPSVIPSVFKKPFEIHEVKEEPSSLDIATMKPAINNGFKPDSVVVESGFRPIIRQQADGMDTEIGQQTVHRREDPGTEIDEVMETDTLFLTAQKETQSLNFEPMFIPSPLDSTNATIIRKLIASPPVVSAALPLISTADDIPSTAKLVSEVPKDDVSKEDFLNDAIGRNSEEHLSYDDVTVKRELNEDDDHLKYDTELESEFMDDEIINDDDEDDEREAQAAERIDSYYLPPDNRKIPHSNIPSGAVVTYDGKALLDTSLVLPPKLEGRDSSNLRRQNHGLSKIDELIRNTPQFRPFRGEIPPPIPDVLSTVRSLQLGNNPITEYSNPLMSSSTAPKTQSTSSISNTFKPHLSSSSSRPISTKLHSTNLQNFA